MQTGNSIRQMYSGAAPIPPPKPGNHDSSRKSTPKTGQSPRQPPSSETTQELNDASGQPHQNTASQALLDPGSNWLPKILEKKSKQDLANVLASSELLSALTHSTSTVHPSLAASRSILKDALDENIQLATHLLELEARLVHHRTATHAQLLGALALERTWKAKQVAMDTALAPFAPTSMYQRLASGVAEHEQVCKALEESFLDGQGDGTLASEREATEWVRRYREARKLFYMRKEKKERWDEGRVGGWR